MYRTRRNEQNKRTLHVLLLRFVNSVKPSFNSGATFPGFSLPVDSTFTEILGCGVEGWGGGGAGGLPQAFFIAWSCLFCARDAFVQRV